MKNRSHIGIMNEFNGSRAQELQLEQIWELALPYWDSNKKLGHGPDHARRVCRHAQMLARRKGASLFRVTAAAYLVDVGINDSDLHHRHAERSAAIARQILHRVGVDTIEAESVCKAVILHSSSVRVPDSASTETMILRESDLLDRLGIPGIRMTLAYGEFVRRCLYKQSDPICIPPRAPELDNYTMDYVRFLETLADRLLWDESLTIAEQKVSEIEIYLMRFRELTLAGPMPTYGDAVDLANRLAKEGE